MPRIGIGELIVIFLIILLLFGASRLPEIARALGRSIREFKKGAKDLNDEIEKAGKEETDKKEHIT
ncbi:MAG: twin-arginine translocase TatA/TatE family subunit [Candidatus Omnitrophica bacterium]|nr:twin-arginine translocase TatA/TatE family subunit [Candidatus Omnitrophota bacterium]